MSKHILTDAEEEALINEATLEDCMRDPWYVGRFTDDKVAMAVANERAAWRRLYPTDEDKQYALPFPDGWWEDEWGMMHPPATED